MIYLSFDIEEFDMPKEYGYDIAFERQIAISREGLTAIRPTQKTQRQGYFLFDGSLCRASP